MREKSWQVKGTALTEEISGKEHHGVGMGKVGVRRGKKLAI